MANTTKPDAKPAFIPSECLNESPIDLMGKKLCQLSSLLHANYGGGQENFNDLSPAHRNQLLWLASDLTEQIQDLIRPVWDEAFAHGQKALAQQTTAILGAQS
jgi:hypothetical protein